MPDVWFIRHGECTANVGGATRTAAEALLTSKGNEQAQRIADYLRSQIDRKPTRIIVSSYKRAQQTAQPTLQYFKDAHSQIGAVHEFNYLALPGDVFTTSTDRLPLVKEFWNRCNPSFKHENKAESFDAFISRVKRVMKNLRLSQESDFIIVFSHHQFIQAVKWLLENKVNENGVQPDEMNHFYQSLKKTPLPNGAILKTFLGPAEQRVLSCDLLHLTDSTQPACAQR